jgi:magnesium-transporting ATPase (P-type)
MDKTGTMTEGVFKVQEVILKPEFNKDEILQMVNALKVKVHTQLLQPFIIMLEKLIAISS